MENQQWYFVKSLLGDSIGPQCKGPLNQVLSDHLRFHLNVCTQNFTTQVMQSQSVMQNDFSRTLHSLKFLFLLGIINMILWKLIEGFLMQIRELWKISENQRSAKHTFALDMVHNGTGTGD